MMDWLLFMMAFVRWLVKILLPLPFASRLFTSRLLLPCRLKESIRMMDQDNTKAVDRSKYRLIQTPQTFRVSLIRKAYEMQEDLSLTDDASVAENAGHVISLFEGSYENIKITTTEDLIIADALLKSEAEVNSSRWSLSFLRLLVPSYS